MDKVLALEPYFGGSHRSFLEGLEAVLPGGMDFITLPARKWKWRMRLSAPWLAGKLRALGEESDRPSYRALLCSTFVDVAALKALLPPWAAELPVCTYFHENQFAYPVRVEMERDFHFALTNLTTAMASDRLAFNSRYNLTTFTEGCRGLLKKSYDMKLAGVEEEILKKTRVISPGLDFSGFEEPPRMDPGRYDKTPVILWNHRWEFDKNPERFFGVLGELLAAGEDFLVIVLGQSFRDSPRVFERAAESLGDRLLQFGYAESREDYLYWLKRADIVVSTAIHEFFGMAVIEAVRAGCRPLLPRRLAYPELFPARFLYDEDDLAGRLSEILREGPLTPEEAQGLTERFSWQSLERQYTDWLA